MVMNHDSWLITDHQEEEGATTRGKNGGGMGAAFLLNAFGADVKFEDKFDVEDEEIATGNQGDLERFFKHGSTGLDTLLTNGTPHPPQPPTPRLALLSLPHVLCIPIGRFIAWGRVWPCSPRATSFPSSSSSTIQRLW